MKKLIITIALLMTVSVNAQQKPIYKVEGDKIVKVDAPKEQPIKTNLTHTIKDSVYVVYKGAKGGYFIIRKSKKSGKLYRMYLPTN